MSIDYYAIGVRDQALVGPIVEGSEVSHPIDAAKVRTALRTLRSLQGSERGTLSWESSGDYISVDVLPTHVLVTHNAGRGSFQIEVLVDIMDVLQREGLHVYDPQQGRWFFGLG